MGQIQLLINELTVDPLSLGYSTMTNVQVKDSLNSAVRNKNKSSIATADILEAIDPAELMALAGEKSVRVWGVLGMDSIDPFGVAVEVFKDAFGNTSATLVALAALRKESVSRAQELGYPGLVKEGHVEMARVKMGV